MHKKFDKPQAQNQQHLLKRVAWVNIIAQFAFPLAGTLTPIIAAAEAHRISQLSPLAIPTEPYILKPGETIHTIAKRYSFTINQLKEINKFRTFSKPFSILGVGDEIDIPKSRPNKYLPFNYFSSEPFSKTDDTERKLANAAIRVGEILNSNKVSDSAINQISHLAAGETPGLARILRYSTCTSSY
ncbi:LysM peptidoglycan-binding domain-containing protein [Xenorhabdus sp. SGI246]|uniref:LysM peptidoglycan-binding domain-containing protein n=1 Tax=Xenorhabdus sp. SGI246 TaxID=3158263 RepID=UPI00349F446E